MSKKQTKLTLWRKLTSAYDRLAESAWQEYAGEAASRIFGQEIGEHLKAIRAALKTDDPQVMKTVYDEAVDMFGHIIMPEVYAKPAEPEPAAPQVDVRLADDLAVIYSNFAIISHSESEIVVDFAKLLPGLSTAMVDARVIMTPANTRLLLDALLTNLSIYDRRYGARQHGAEYNPFAGEPPDWLVDDVQVF